MSTAASTAPRRIAIVGGGTAGHVYPGLAVASEYRRRLPHVEIVFLGTPRGYESQLVPAAGFELTTLRGSPWLRTGIAGKARALANGFAGTLKARRILRTHASQLVIGFGGYASAGTVFAARTLGVPIVLHESNVQPGLTNRRLARFADRIYLAFAEAESVFPAGRTLLTGTPVRAEVWSAGADKQPPRAGEAVQVLVSGGSLGADFLDRHVPPLLARLRAGGIAIEVTHQVGLSDRAAAESAYRAAGVPARVVDYLEDMPAAYREADFAISSAGAVTLAELAAAALPCLIVPLASASEDHQSANARAFGEATGALWTREQEWNQDRLAGDLPPLLRDSERWRCASKSLRDSARPDAAGAIVADCEALLETSLSRTTAGEG